MFLNKPGHSVSYKITDAPSEDSDQPAHLSCLIGIFEGHTGDTVDSL